MWLLDNARTGDVIIVWKLDRVARSIRQLIDTTALLHDCGGELHSLSHGPLHLVRRRTQSPILMPIGSCSGQLPRSFFFPDRICRSAAVVPDEYGVGVGSGSFSADPVS